MMYHSGKNALPLGAYLMNKMILKVIIIIAALYILICALLYVFQENLIFYPQKLTKNYRFGFHQPFEELNITTNDKTQLNGLLFKADSSKGLIFYLHGNAGAIDSWGEVASTYTALNYDVFLLDYRGYGKSEGVISGQEQLFEDIQTVYDSLKNRYPENKIVVLGYSIGTGPATKLASVNNPKLLILQAPYFSLSDMMQHAYPIIPTFILKYKFETNNYLKSCKMPVVVFHGNQDEVIYYGSSLKLKSLFKKQDTLITLEGQGHNGITDNPYYRTELQRILAR
jgi:pimeloyl-ACP methyl ester carboxylesterase